MKCPECKQNYEGYVCTNCGLVIEDKPIDFSASIRFKDTHSNKKVVENAFYKSNAPDIEFMTYHTNKTSNPELKKAFKNKDIGRSKGFKQDYVKVFYEIKRICAYLLLPTIIVDETLELYKSVIRKDKKFFSRKNYKFNGISACIKISARIHSYPLSIIDLVERTKTYHKIEKKGNYEYNFHEVKTMINRIILETLQLLKIRLPKKDIPNYINVYASELDIPYKYIKKMIIIGNHVKKHFDSAFKIEGYAIAIIFQLANAYGFQFKIFDLAEKFHISPVTISSRIKELKKIRGFNISLKLVE